MKRKIITGAVIIVCFLLQCTIFNKLALGSIKPNLLIILTSSFGFMRGHKDGMVVGFFSGLLIDIEFGNLIGFYALIYTLIGFINGFFSQIYYDDDVELPLYMIAGSEFVYGLTVYIFMFLMRSEFDFIHYLGKIIIPELIYTMVITLGLYPLTLYINRKLEAEEKRSASKFV
ncbi:rod shape-determining protein MreD [Hespellia stercorisuis]|uniref:Rod shape-determining protein MreD n=1 Tax=Hespellia stercorisuis DSM 15480 TaxID=1121950 RepID=A0A1M6N3N5_9FIRM|nr:rod shape-determining protein MreD [Hespellia stercorisuis]SHJ90272.1 rod shape-determining protein MreD [Hespellia stercorisuis DSM 15480]